MAQRNTGAKQKKLWGRSQSSDVTTFAMTMPSAAPNLRQVKDGIEPRNIRDVWVREAYVYADEIPEVGFVMSLQSAMGSQCRLLPQEFDLENKEWVVTEDERVLRVHAAFIGPLGGTPELLRRGFLHLGIGGEALLLGTPTLEVDREYGIHWEFLSSEELVAQRGGKTVRKADGVTAEPLDEKAYVARVYRPHFAFSGLNDSPMRRVLGVCKQLADEQQLRSAITRSHLAAQIFYVPEEMEFPDAEPEEGVVDQTAGDTTSVSPFIKRLSDHLRAPIEDRGSIASLVPLIMRGPAELYGKFGLVEISRGLETMNQELRKEDLQRLAAGLDIDPAIIDGYAGVNHWTAYAIDSGFIAKHVRPTGELLAHQLTDYYLRMMLEIFEGMKPQEVMRYRWQFDPSPIMARTDEAASSRVIYEMGPLSEDSLLKANGFDSSDKSSPEERKYRLAVELLRRDPVSMGPVVAPYLGLEDWAWDAMPAPAAGPAGPGGPGGAAGGFIPPVPQPGSPLAQQGGVDQSQGMQEPVQTLPAMSMLVNQLATAGDSAISRAMEKAAARFATKGRRNDRIRETIKDAKGSSVLSLVGPSDLALVDCPIELLLENAWDMYSLDARRWVRTYMERSGTPPMRADDIAVIAVQELCRRLQSLVEVSIHDSLPYTQNGTRVADRMVKDALTYAGVT